MEFAISSTTESGRHATMSGFPIGGRPEQAARSMTGSFGCNWRTGLRRTLLNAARTESLVRLALAEYL